MPTFLTSFQYRDIDTVICELEQNYNGKEVLYLIKLPKFPKNLEQMAIARYLFKLLFNCVFEYFEIHRVLFNPQMIDLLFDVENETTNFPLQVHSQNTKLPFLWNNDPCFVWNHLVSNRLRVDMHAYDTEYLFNDNVQDIDIFNDLTQGPTSRFRTFVFGLYKMLTEGGNKFLNITCTHLDSRLYNLIIKVCTFLL
ncbi:unnamed protein product [Meloidogyne enterolobii]|uniref:Uncharacterized protein n=1 Tax=Meloidogyne enterolobii TaxID=390850 RepID=A0ACB1AZM5_MELEN